MTQFPGRYQLKTTRVLVCDCGTLLGLGVESVLASDKDLVVFSALPEDEVGLIKAIDWFKPEVVILGECMVVSDKTTLHHILVKYPLLRLITISIDNNWLHIYQRQDIWLDKASGLTGVIRNVRKPEENLLDNASIG